MIGRSYNGTLPNAVAATGVEGLTTIVPIAAISSWYDYSRMGGIIGGTLHYPSWLANYVTDAPRQPICAPIRADMDLIDGDADGNMNAFWDERNYRPNADKVKASVFATHCLQDDNVDPDQTTEWWYQLAKHNVPRKLWLCREGHIDPFMTNRAEWMRQLHAWFDHWLLGDPERDHGRAPRRHREHEGQLGQVLGLAAPRLRRDPDLPARRHADHRRHDRRPAGREDGHAHLDRRLEHERGQRDEHRVHDHAEQPPRVPERRRSSRTCASPARPRSTCTRPSTSHSRTSPPCSSTTARPPRSRGPATASARRPARRATAGARRPPAPARTAP